MELEDQTWLIPASRNRLLKVFFGPGGAVGAYDGPTVGLFKLRAGTSLVLIWCRN